MSHKIAVIYGSVREGRQGIKAAKFLINKLKKRGHHATLVDPLQYDLPLLKKMYKSYEKGEAPDSLEKLKKVIENSDAYIIVSGEYNHSIPPALSNLLDHFMKEYFWKPSGIVTYSAGNFGGVRVLSQLRSILSELGTPTIPSTFPISKVQDSFDEKGNALDPSYDKRVGKFIDELERYTQALERQRQEGTPY